MADSTIVYPISYFTILAMLAVCRFVWRYNS